MGKFKVNFNLILSKNTSFDIKLYFLKDNSFMSQINQHSICFTHHLFVKSSLFVLVEIPKAEK